MECVHRRSSLSSGYSFLNLCEAALVRTKLTKAIFQTMGSLERSWKLQRFLGKLFGRFGLHIFKCGLLVLTEVVWFHHSYIKFIKQRAEIPEGSPNYWWKVLAPTFAYGSKHAILFQLVLIPLTMSRHMLALLSSSSFLSKIVPFEHMTELHVFLGYIFCAVTGFATLVFLVFWGKVCIDFKAGRDPLDTCSGLQSEIMISGYVIALATLVVIISARFRNKTSFEVFYILHHLVFVVYLAVVVHTLDLEFRNGRQRSQTYTWLTASMVIYISDRLWTSCTAHRNVPVQSISVARDASVLALSLERPRGFEFRSGQHAFLQIPVIDWTWHPFSISSEPSCREVRFLIEVKAPGSWTHKLEALSGDVSELRVNLMGGFGSSGFKSKSNVEVLAVGTGTGIVPMISLLLERKRRLLLLNKFVLVDASDVSTRSIKGEEQEFSRLRYLQLSWRLRQVKRLGARSSYIVGIRRKSQWELLHSVVDVAACLLILLELWLCATTISWASFPGGTNVDSTMGRTLRSVTLAAVALYAAHALYRLALPLRFKRSFRNVFDLFTVGAMVVTLVVWWEVPFVLHNSVGVARVGARVAFCIWRLSWLWCTTPVMRHAEAGQGNLGRELLGESTFRLIWSCRSADVLQGCLPEFEEMLLELQVRLQTTLNGLKTFLSLEFYCTEGDPIKQRRLRNRMRGTPLEGSVHFGRPDVKGAIYQVMRRQLADGLNRGSVAKRGAQSLVMFCGSPVVGKLCMQYVEEANLLANALAFYNHKIIFREESIWAGGQASAPKKLAEGGGHGGSGSTNVEEGLGRGPEETPEEVPDASDLSGQESCSDLAGNELENWPKEFTPRELESPTVNAGDTSEGRVLRIRL